MKILIGGITGSGKSSVANILKERGADCIDDSFDHELSYWANKQTGERMPDPVDFSQPLDWKWDEKYLQRRLEKAADQNIFIFGNSANQSSFYHLFDRLFVLMASNETIKRRIRARTDNSFGKTAGELAWVLQENERLTSELQAAGAIAIDASQPLDTVLGEILSYVD